MIQKRSLALTIVFSIITFGIYYYYWVYKMAKDVNAICEGDGNSTSGLLKFILLSIITLGIYALFWMYALGDRLRDNGKKYDLNIQEGGSTVILWMILGSMIIVGPFIALHIIIKNTNALAEAYNKKISATPEVAA